MHRGGHRRTRAVCRIPADLPAIGQRPSGAAAHVDGQHSGASGRSSRGSDDMTTNTDVRKWAREHGIPVTNRGPIAAELRERYEAEHGDGAADPIVFGGPGYDGGVTEADFPPALEHQAQTPARQDETRPKKVTAPNAFQRWRDRNKPKAAARAGAGRKRARVSLAGLIEDTWSQMAWAATPLPPMQRLLHAQAPM